MCQSPCCAIEFVAVGRGIARFDGDAGIAQTEEEAAAIGVRGSESARRAGPVPGGSEKAGEPAFAADLLMDRRDL